MEISEILLSESSFLYTVLHNVRFSGNNSRVCNLSFWYLSFIQIKDDHLICFYHSYKPSPHIATLANHKGRRRNSNYLYDQSPVCLDLNWDTKKMSLEKSNLISSNLAHVQRLLEM